VWAIDWSVVDDSTLHIRYARLEGARWRRPGTSLVWAIYLCLCKSVWRGEHVWAIYLCVCKSAWRGEHVWVIYLCFCKSAWRGEHVWVIDLCLCKSVWRGEHVWAIDLCLCKSAWRRKTSMNGADRVPGRAVYTCDVDLPLTDNMAIRITH
jgi:hypothetical protein